MKITLNLATRPYADLGPAMKRLRMGMGALAVLCLVLYLGLHMLHSRAEAARDREHSLDGQLARVTAERMGYIHMMAEPENAALIKQVKALNDIFDQKAFSWTLAMESLETVLPGGVMVTTLEPVRDDKGQITLHLRLVGPHDLDVNLARNLEHSKRFVNPRITGENAEAAGNGSNQHLEPVSATNRFDYEILAEYNPPTLEERRAAKSAEKKSEETPAAQRIPLGMANPAHFRPNPALRREVMPGKPGMRVRPANPARPRKPNPATLQPGSSGGGK